MIASKGEYIIEMATSQEKKILGFLRELGADSPARIGSTTLYIVTIKNQDVELIKSFPGVLQLILNEDIATIPM